MFVYTGCPTWQVMWDWNRRVRCLLLLAWETAQLLKAFLHVSIKSNSLFSPNTVCWINWRKAWARDFFICWSSASTTGLSSLAKLRTPQTSVTWQVLLPLLFYCIESCIPLYKKALLVQMCLCHLLKHFAGEGLRCGYWQLQSQTGLLNAFLHYKSELWLNTHV